jgi:hypothetical protein
VTLAWRVWTFSKVGRKNCEMRKTGSVKGVCAAGGGLTLEIEVWSLT